MKFEIANFLILRGIGARFRGKSTTSNYENLTSTSNLESFYLYLFFCLVFLAIAGVIANVPFSTFPKNPLKWHLHLLFNSKHKNEDSNLLQSWWLSSIFLWASILCLIVAIITIVAIFFQDAASSTGGW